MSTTQTEREAQDRLLESTPSQESKETPGWARLIGLVGTVCFGAGLLMYLYNAYVYLNVLKGTVYKEGVSIQRDPWLFGFVIFFLLAGLLGLLVQASKEREVQQRRMLAMLGAVFLSLGVLYVTNLLVSEGVAKWLAPAASGATQDSAALEKAASQGRWAGLAALAVMSVVLLSAWMAPFVREAAGVRLSIFRLPGAWVTRMGEGRISVCTLLGFLAVVLLSAAAFFLKDPIEAYSEKILGYSPVHRLAYGQCSYGVLLILIGIPFMLIFARTEEDEAWRRVPGSLFTTVGVLAAFFGMVGVFSDLVKVPDYTLPYGFSLSVLGLICLGLGVGQQGGESDSGYTLSKWIGWSGLVVLILAAVRSLLPTFVEMTWLQDLFPSLEEVNIGSYLVPNGFLYMVAGGAFAFLGLTLASDNKLFVLTRRELAGFFTSPIGYVVLGGTVVAAWVSFWVWLSDLSDPQGFMGTPEPVVLRYFFGIFPVIFMVVAVPMLTMRLVSEEQRSGTMEVLLTAPVSEISIIVSKFLATWIFYLVCWLLWLVFPIILRVAGQESFDYRPMLSIMLGLGAMGFGFIGMGLFFSSLTKNQIVAFLLTFAGMFACIMIYFIQFFISSSSVSGGFRAETTNALVETVKYVSFIDHLLAFSRGSVYFKNILFHISLGCFWLFMTMRVLESRKWR